MKGMLKVLAIALCLALAVAVLGAAQPEDVSGTWTATMRRGGKTGNFVMTLQAAGDQLTGTLHDPSGQTMQIENGKLEGNRLTFDAAAQEHGHSKTIHFSGDIADYAITLRNESNGRKGATIIFHRSAE